MGEAYRLQARARRAAAAARLPQAQTTTLLDPPLSSVVDSLSRLRPSIPDPSDSRKRRALGNRGEVARAEEMLEEAEAVPALLAALGLAPSALGPVAEAQGVAPTALHASDAVRALALKELRGADELPLRESVEERPAPPGFGEKIDALLTGAATRSGHASAAAAARRLREALQDGIRDRPASGS